MQLSSYNFEEKADWRFQWEWAALDVKVGYTPEPEDISLQPVRPPYVIIGRTHWLETMYVK